MSSINRITLVGVISNDPDARVTNAGDPMLRFNIATERPSIDGAPAAVDYIPVIAWRQVAEAKDQYVKGALVLVDGRIVTRSFEDNDGKRKWTTEVDAKEIRLLGQQEIGASFLESPSSQSVAKVAPAKKRLEKAVVDEVSLDDFDFGEPKGNKSYVSGPKFDADLDEDIPF